MTKTEFWQAVAQATLPIVQSAVNLIADGHEVADQHGKVLVDVSRYSDLLDAVNDFKRRAAEEEANNAE